MQKFPKNFIFSTSTCSYQIEGGRQLGGRKYSNWDKFTIENYYIPPAGSTEREIASIEVAADFYHKYQQDVKIMQEIGVNGFAYNLDWARIFPDDAEHANEEGLAFYESVFQALTAAGIKPIPILYHWDTPLWLEALGGSSAPVFVSAFQKYAQVMFERLGKYTDLWFVSDENSSYTMAGYLDDYCPPGKKDEKEFWKAIYYLSISGAAAKVVFEQAKTKGFLSQAARLGIDHDWHPAIPFDPNDPDDLEAVKIYNQYNLKLYLDPNIKGTFPDCFYQAVKKWNLEMIVQADDLKLLEQNRLDLIGWNYYRPAIVAHPKRLRENHQWHREPQFMITKEVYLVYPQDKTYTAWGWLIMPEYIAFGLEELWKAYKKELIILENGLGYFDQRQDGVVADHYRIDYLNAHLQEVQKVVAKGIPILGYSLWTYCDIFSPSGGYRKCYGLVGVDFQSPNCGRYPKASMYWYQDVIANRTTIVSDKIDYQKYEKAAKLSFEKLKIWN